MISPFERMDLKPFLHEHHLVYDKYEKQEACCDKCNLQIDGWAFTCEICKFWLHHSCAVQQLPLKIGHSLHPQHPLELLYKESKVSFHFFCNGCSSLTRNFLYQCLDCKFNLDLICASSATTITSHRYKKISHFCHDDPLTRFKYRKVSKYHYTCFWCQKLLSGVSYGCFLCHTELFVHETCLMNMSIIISKHHSHPSHQLQLGVGNSKRSFPCGVCGYRIWDTREGYLCPKCQFLIHFKCVKFKPSLKHELHQHRLTLLPIKPDPSSYELKPCEKCRNWIHSSEDSVCNYYYRCVSCGFNFHLRCLIPSGIKHKYHRHQLMLTHVFLEDYSDQYYCDVCEEERKPADPVYCCNKCTFVAHIGCALNQISIVSKLNNLSQNKSIMDSLPEYAYVDDESTSNLLGEKDSIRELKEEDEMNHRNANSSTHFEIQYCEGGHHLIFYEDVEKHKRGDRCSICWLEISDEAYACKICEFYIHKTCIRWPFEVTHPLHPQHSLKLIPSYEDYLGFGYKCQECAGINMRFAYVCYECDFVLDVKCATSWVPKNETQRLKDTETQSMLCLFNQDHKLGYANYPYNFPGVGNCSFCGLYLSGPTYRCFQCRYKLHESCVGIPREMQIQFHPLHLLRPLWNPPQHCRVCKYPFFYLTNKISYSCEQCDLYLHPYCAQSLKHVLKSKSHIHDLYYFGSNIQSHYYRDEKVCDECGEEFSCIPFCFCMECDAKLHIERVLPRSLKSKYHIHPLTLKDAFKEDDSEEYYCDICEEERDIRDVGDHVYHCTECRVPFVAHISCALNSEEEIAASSNLALDSCPSAGTDLGTMFRRGLIKKIEVQ